MDIIGHRGALNDALENSLESFDKAVSAGAKRIELDVQVTQEGQLVVIHDESFKRTTDSEETVYSTPPHKIREIRLKNGEPVPMLEDVIARFLPKIELNIELKGSKRELAQKVISCLPPIKERQNRVIISSFDLNLLSFTAKEFPDEEIAVLWEKPDSHEELETWMSICNSIILHPEVKIYDDKLARLCKKNGWKVVPYISNQDESDKTIIWERLLKLGVQGLCTNYPRELKEWLEKRDSDDKVR